MSFTKFFCSVKISSHSCFLLRRPRREDLRCKVVLIRDQHTWIAYLGPWISLYAGQSSPLLTNC